MNGIDSYKNEKDFEGQADLREVLSVLFKKRRIIGFISSFCLIIGFFYSLFLPDIFESEALLAPVSESKSLSGNLGGLDRISNLAGLNFSTTDSTENHKKALEVMSSLNFFENHLLPRIFLPDLMALDSWNESENKVIYDDDIFKMDSNTWIKYSSNNLTPSAQESFEVFINDHLTISQDPKTGYVYLSVKHQSPFISKEWIQIVYEEINDFYRKKDAARSEKAVSYLNNQMATTSLSEIKQVIASLLKIEIQKLTLVEANRDYVYEYIYPPSVMEKKSEPRRPLISILSFLFGVLFGMIYVLFKHYFFNEKLYSKN